MYESEKRVFRAINIFSDIFLVAAAFYTVKVLRDLVIGLGLFGLKALVAPVVARSVLFTMAFFYPVLLYFNQFYPTIRIRRFQDKIYILLKTIFQLAIIIISLSFISDIRFNRTLIAFSCPILFMFAIAKEFLLSHFASHRQKKGHLKSTLLIGDKRHIDSILKKMHEEELSLEITRTFQAKLFSGNNNDIKGCSLSVDIDEIVDVLEKESIELVVIAGFHGDEDEIRDILVICEERGIEVWLESPLLVRKGSRTSFGYLANIPMVVFSTAPGYDWQMLLKTLFDYTVAILLLPFFCIACIFIAIGIKLSSPGPVIFKQYRGGLYGKPFIFLKFRTMTNDAEQKKDELQKFNIMKGPVFKIKDDPRVFLFGKFLRKHSFDELPQIINILRGEMSVVGPRPLPVDEVKKIKGADRRRLSMKPGLTCLWQISGRSEIKDFAKWVRLDLEYIDKWSIILDLNIFIKTVFTLVFERKGAY